MCQIVKGCLVSKVGRFFMYVLTVWTHFLTVWLRLKDHSYKHEGGVRMAAKTFVVVVPGLVWNVKLTTWTCFPTFVVCNVRSLWICDCLIQFLHFYVTSSCVPKFFWGHMSGIISLLPPSTPSSCATYLVANILYNIMLC